MPRKRRLSEDDLAVWKQVARTTNPLHPNRKKRVSDPVVTAKPKKPSKSEPELKVVTEFRIGQAARYDQSKGHDLGHTLEQRLAGQPVRMDKKTFGRMKKGKLKPERKIDLHGMTLSQAHPALNRFIMSAHADGCRLVLVVTGKGEGKGRQDDGPIPTPRGVLRNQVPQWLHLAPLSTMVLQVIDAHISHGGSGAYYVYLSRRR
ncbi:Smr/MutS family protein [Aliiruegeria lutimaris]|uniref:DNA-nicking endonuclease, Smr domain n=1 Tax=Aliiruegeria lutimaris TaxID=571298 RepID=A0A1G8NC53_9RHOB|nr:Smr/MutS family protein [Aliiruegeria lutimaris]SDI77647.1 DNA-nicking endonuclease, Smr domain [Aliiruegeria lutimaris]